MSQWPEEDDPSFWRSLWVGAAFAVCIIAMVGLVLLMGSMMEHVPTALR